MSHRLAIKPLNIGIALALAIGLLISAFASSATTTFAHGCTRTPGYYKNHSAVVETLVPLDFQGYMLASNTQEALEILRYGGPDMHRNMLKHLLAAKFNIHSGADHNIQQALDDARAYLGGTLKLNRSQLEDLKDIFDRYNNGDPTLGPGACD